VAEITNFTVYVKGKGRKKFIASIEIVHSDNTVLDELYKRVMEEKKGPLILLSAIKRSIGHHLYS